MRDPSSRTKIDPGGATLLILVSAAQSACTDAFDDLVLATDGGDPPSGCLHAEPPSRPSQSKPDFEFIEFVTAARDYDFGDLDRGTETERYLSMGYDLDALCTGQGQGPSCAKEEWTTDLIVDGQMGRDNAFGEMIYRQTRSDGVTSPTEAMNAAVEFGGSTIAIRVGGYNGTDTDASVEVAVYAATMNRLGGAPEPPSWDGTDGWAAGSLWVNTDDNGRPSADFPKYYDRRAYVTDWILVAHLNRLALPAMLNLSRVVLTARIVNEDRLWSLRDGTLAGRVRADDVLAGFELVRNPDNGEYFCTNSRVYRWRKEAVCGFTDITYEGTADPSVPCDAFSLGLRFTALPARLSGTVDVTLPENCRADRSPANDSCASRD